MENVRDLKRRIKSVKSTQHITSAMKMVAVAKLKRVQGSLHTILPYEEKLHEVVAHLRESKEASHIYLEPRSEVKKIAYVVMGGDQGLCGAYNNTINRFGESILKSSPKPYYLIVVGSKVKHFFEKSGYKVDMDFTDIADQPSYMAGKRIGEIVAKLYETDEVDEVHLVFTGFRSAMSQQPVREQILPIPGTAGGEEHHSEFILDPDTNTILSTVLPQYLEMSVYVALLQSKASELGARMVAMSGATDNADALIADLTLSLNRVRQAAITTEISEIVGGAAALS